VTVVTSVAPNITRKSTNNEEIGARWLNLCLQSWSTISSDVWSVSETSPPPGNVQWLRTQERPSIAELFRAMAHRSDKHIVLTNADIALTTDFHRILNTLDPSTVYYGSRLDADATIASKEGLELVGPTFYPWGFDLFVLTPEFVRLVNEKRVLPEEFRIGEPWWDYLLPIVALAYGFPIKNFRCRNLAVHLRHETAYSKEVWRRNGQRFVALISDMIQDPRCVAVGALSDVIAVSGSEDERLGAICNNICLDLP